MRVKKKKEKKEKKSETKAEKKKRKKAPIDAIPSCSSSSSFPPFYAIDRRTLRPRSSLGTFLFALVHEFREQRPSRDEVAAEKVERRMTTTTTTISSSPLSSSATTMPLPRACSSFSSLRLHSPSATREKRYESMRSDSRTAKRRRRRGASFSCFCFEFRCEKEKNNNKKLGVEFFCVSKFSSAFVTKKKRERERARRERKKKHQEKKEEGARIILSFFSLFCLLFYLPFLYLEG